MENTLFVTAEIVAKDLGVSKPFAYKLVRQMNDELNAKGYLTVAGRVSRKYYEERFYGLKVLRSVYSAFLDLSNRFERLQESYSRERSRNEHLKGRLQEMIEENRELRETAEDMECVKAVFGSQKVDEAISQAKRQEKIERERKQTMKKKHDREAI